MVVSCSGVMEGMRVKIRDEATPRKTSDRPFGAMLNSLLCAAEKDNSLVSIRTLNGLNYPLRERNVLEVGCDAVRLADGTLIPFSAIEIVVPSSRA